MKEIAVAAEAIVDAPAARVFAVANGDDPRAFFAPSGAIPGVAAIAGHKGPWSTPGEIRDLTLTDGASLREELIICEPVLRFAYRAYDFTGALKPLVSYAEGEWRFTQEGEATRLEWRYRFFPRTAAASVAVLVIAKLLWPGYMRAVLRRIMKECERPQ